MNTGSLTESADPLDAVAEAYLDRCRRGERPAVEEYARRYPELAGRIRALFPALEALERAGGEPGGGDPERLGEYRILRRIGRGGMGVVYEAVQEPLGRHVALKVLAAGPHAHPTLLERFQREARTAAKLHHGNIVPVFGVGADRGAHFFAMQFIAGAGLDRVIDDVRRLRSGGTTAGGDDSSSWLTAPGGDYHRKAAALAAQAADALAYAHRHGVLHRDVKPSNLLLDAHGTLWVADFGLAKEAGAEDLTTTGDIVGTLRYLAPERLNGDADARSDVYSLGATLYELLTLRPVYDAADRPVLVKQVTDGEPVPPRRLDPSVPADLETVVLKALAREPRARYATAADLADDLRNVIADRPVRARRLSAAGRLARWARRNPLVATLAGAAAGLATVVAVGSTVTALVLATKNAELAAANDRGRQRFDLAMDAIGLFHGGISEDLLLKEKQFDRLRGKLLGSAADFYNRLETQLRDQGDPASREALGRAYHQLGGLVLKIGNGPEAMAVYRKGAAVRRERATTAGADTGPWLELARTLAELAVAEIFSAELSAAAATVAEARAAVDRVETVSGASAASRAVVARLLVSEGSVAWNTGRVAEAEASYEQARAVLELLAGQGTGDLATRKMLGDSHLNLGSAAVGFAETVDHFRKALGHYRACAAAEPANSEYQFDVAHCRGALANFTDLRIPPSTALADAEAARAIAGRLVAEFPAITEFRRVLALACGNAGKYHALAGRPGEARAAWEESLAHWDQTCASSADPRWRAARAGCHSALAELDLDAGRLEAALAGHRRAVAAQEQVTSASRSDWDRSWLAFRLRRLGLAELAAGRPADAAQATRRARELLGPLLPKLAPMPMIRLELACCHATLSGLAGRADSGVPESDGPAEADRAMAKVIETLNTYRPYPAVLARDRGLDPLRQRPDFARVMAELEADARRAGP